MTDLITAQASSLPANIDDLSKFVLIGTDKLQAVRAEISAIQKLGLAKEVHEQKLREGQDIADMVTLAKMRMGELLNELPKAARGNGSNQYNKNAEIRPASKFSTDEKPQSKLETAKELGFSKDQISQLQQMAKNPDAVHSAMAKARENNDIVSQSSVMKEIKEAKKQTQVQERAERKQYELQNDLPADAYKLFQADIREGLPQIADNSIDFIITDPPYPREYIPLYRELSKVAKRILKDGGSLVCMVGQSYLPEIIKELETSMTYHWCMCYLTPGATPQLWQKRTNTFWKPLLWFVKGNYTGDWIGNDVMQSPAEDKTFHKWGQSIGGMKDIVERFTNPNDTIFDPFVGGGSTGVVTVTSGRKFIGADIDTECLATTEQRVKEAYNLVKRNT